MKKVLMSLALGVMVTALHAQDFKLAKSTGRLEIREVNHVSIEGTTGNEIIFSSINHDRDRDERAVGLRAISSMGIEDNTGLGISVVDKGATVEVRQLKKMDGPEILIKVPKGVIVSYVHSSPYGDEVKIKNFDGEVEVSTVHNGVELSNDTGPLTIKTIHGDIDASLAPGMKSPVSLISVHGRVDASMALATKANLKLATIYGDIYVDPGFKLDIEKVDGLERHSDHVDGKINGGGLDVTLSSTHNNVYLRKN